MAEFLEMGGYGAFVWPAYGAVALVLLGLWITSRRFVATTEAELDNLNPRQTGDRDEA